MTRAQAERDSAALQYTLDGVGLGRGDPQAVRALHRDLRSDVLTSVALGRGEPRGGVARSLLLVRRSVDRTQVQRVVGELLAGLSTPLLGALLPCVGEGDNVVDLDGRGRVLPALEVDRLPGVGVLERPAQDDAAVRALLEGAGSEVAAQPVVAGVASVEIGRAARRARV